MIESAVAVRWWRFFWIVSALTKAERKFCVVPIARFHASPCVEVVSPFTVESSRRGPTELACAGAAQNTVPCDDLRTGFEASLALLGVGSRSAKRAPAPIFGTGLEPSLALLRVRSRSTPGRHKSSSELRPRHSTEKNCLRVREA